MVIVAVVNMVLMTAVAMIFRDDRNGDDNDRLGGGKYGSDGCSGGGG